MQRSHFLVALALVATIFAGTASAQNFFSEDWSTATGTTPPAGWSQINSGVSPTTWRFDNPGLRTFDMAPAMMPGFTGTFAIVDSDWFGPGASGTSILRGPAFSAAGTTLLNLSYDHNYRDLSSTALVEVWDGSAWNIADNFSGASQGYLMPNASTVVNQTTDITAAAGGSANAQIRFNHGYGYDWWWAVDNISIDQPQAIDLAVTSIDSPVVDPTSCVALSNAEVVTITCQWQGSTPLLSGSTIQLDLVVDAGVPVIEFALTTATYNFGDTFQLTLMNTADLSIPGMHTVQVTATVTGDLDPSDDTLLNNYNSPAFTPASVGYFENFDSHTTAPGGTANFAVPTGWLNDPNDAGSLAGATYADWSNEWDNTGSGVGPLADHTTGVAQAGYYMYVEDSAGTDSTATTLITPCFDLSTAPNAALAFWHFSEGIPGGTNDNLLEIDVIDLTSGGTVTMSVSTFAGYGTTAQWTRELVDLTAFGPIVAKCAFRAGNANGTFTDDNCIDDVAFVDNTPDIGQAPQPGAATFDINASVNLLGQGVGSNANGPYFTTVVEGGSFALTTTGQPTQAITVIYGPLNRQVATYPGSGQLDIGLPDANGDGIPEALSVFVDAIAWAGGGFVGFPIDAMFFTNAAGTNTVNFTFPVFGLPSGTPITTFQNVVTQSGGAPFVGNAVDVSIQ